MAADYRSLIEVLNYHRSVGDELLRKNAELMVANQALNDENQQMRRELTAVGERLNNLSRAVGAEIRPTFFQRWFGRAV